ncbi:MAG: hypothetical protein ACI95X_003090 [Paraglaciecola sp.]|jgi:hypothetical protein
MTQLLSQNSKQAPPAGVQTNCRLGLQSIGRSDFIVNKKIYNNTL